jgi:hypothetical protein
MEDLEIYITPKIDNKNEINKKNKLEINDLCLYFLYFTKFDYKSRKRNIII